jgi:cystathionine gamma-synthase
VTLKKTTVHNAGDLGSVESWLISAGRDRRPGAPLNVPPYPASNFVLGEHRGYSRDDGTPGWEALEEIVGGLEGGSSISFASGMAAIAAIFDQLPTGAVIALPDDCYQGVAGLAKAGQSRGRWTVHRLAVTDTEGWIEMCRVADLIWLESPSNPLLTVADLDAICAAPRKRGAILGVDNTFATPLNQRPLALGADVAVQSVTKFISGHSDLLGGVVSVRDADLYAALRQTRELAGAQCDDFGRAPRTPSKRHSDALPRPGEPPHSRCRTTATQRLRYDYLVRCAR